MNEHRYILEPYKGMNTRYHCPSCQHREKTFTCYIDTETGKHIAPTVGRCNRESNCGYHYTPKQYFQDNNISFDTPQAKHYNRLTVVIHQKNSISFIPVEVFKSSLKGYENNFFVDFLISVFDTEIATQLISRYFIGTSKHWPGATIFWQIDNSGKIRTGKIMLYDTFTGKRVKEPFNHITWVHKALKLPEFELKQCLFGEHLLRDKVKPVAIVESEKTAVIASVYFPQFIWLAVGSINNLNSEKCQVLSGRRVTLFPDLNGFEKWNSKAKELSHLSIFTVSDLLERKATAAEREQGLDLADYLLRFYYKEFIEPEPAELPDSVNVPKGYIRPKTLSDIVSTPKELTKVITKPTPIKHGPWGQDLKELEQFFKVAKLPDTIKLNKCSTVTNLPLFIESHLSIVKTQNGNSRYIPYLDRLELLKKILCQN